MAILGKHIGKPHSSLAVDRRKEYEICDDWMRADCRKDMESIQQQGAWRSGNSHMESISRGPGDFPDHDACG